MCIVKPTWTGIGLQLPLTDFPPQDMYVFLSEDQWFDKFDDPSALIWKHEELTYGDWEAGPNKDGTFSIEHKIHTSEVLIKFP